MSIPKEPRQLMINLMYLVLTAMLALNVSAEVINAFFMVDKGIKQSNKIVDKSNSDVIKAINKQAEAYSQFKPLAENAAKAQKISKAFVNYIQKIREEIIEAAGGPYTDEQGHVDPDKPKDKKNKDVTTNILVTNGKGEEIAQEILKVRTEFLKLVDEKDRGAVAAILPLNIDSTYFNADGTWGPDKKTSWGDYTFRQLPAAACMPIFRKFQNDAKTSETAILNYLFGKTGVDEIKLDAFQPVISASKAYILTGETYEAEVFLSAYSTTADNITINVDGSRLPVKEGKAKYSKRPSSVGTKKYNVSISVRNPVTNKTDTYQKTFEYEVGESSASVQLDKMNVFYIGVDNPISVSVAGVSSNDVRVSSGDVNISGSNGKYVVKASKPGDATLTVTGGELKKTFSYRVKRIPDPVARLGNKDEGQIGNGEFKAQAGLIAWLDDFDFDARCNIEGFVLTRTASRQDPVDAPNRGPTFNGQAEQLIRLASPGDTYYFQNVRARCPGDPVARKINSLVFKIK